MKQEKSFTLIELLVVIAIIGLLASIVVVNVNSARDKARVAKSVSFSQQIYRALGSEAVGYWSFSEGAGATTTDNSGNGNIGTISGATWVDGLVFSGGNFGKALSFDGGDYVRIPNSSTYKPTKEVTLEGWALMSEYTDIAKVISLDYRADGSWASPWIVWEIVARHRYSPGVAYLPVTTVVIGGLTYPCWGPDVLELNEWYHFVGVYNHSSLRFYINGKLVNECAVTGDIDYGTSKDLAIGARSPYSLGEFINGLIDEARVYSKSLSSAEIQKYYAKGLEKHQLVKQ